MASLGILSGSLSGSLIYLSLFSRFFLLMKSSLTTDFPSFLLHSRASFTDIYLRPLFPPLTSLCGQPGHIVRLVALLLLLLLLSFPSTFLFFFCLPFLLLLLPFPLPFPLLFHFSKGACPKWLSPTWQHPFVALAQSGRSSPCRAPLAWCHLCFAATLERCSYVPPMLLAPTMPMNVVDHLLNISWHSPHYFRAHASYHLALLGFWAQSTSLVLVSPLTSFFMKLSAL